MSKAAQQRDDSVRDRPRPKKLILSRKTTAVRLGGVSVATVIRMELDGLLTPIRLTGKKRGQVFYSADEVEARARAR
jgi:hypothetical protein